MWQKYINVNMIETKIIINKKNAQKISISKWIRESLCLYNSSTFIAFNSLEICLVSKK